MRGLSAANLLWLVLYLLAVTAIVGGLVFARRWALTQLERPEAKAQWDEWRVDEVRRSEEGRGPVQRRPPVSTEPPALVMLRDHFAAALAACLAIGSVLFGFLMMTIRGILRPTEPHA